MMDRLSHRDPFGPAPAKPPPPAEVALTLAALLRRRKATNPGKTRR